jgi:hypothetical protein
LIADFQERHNNTIRLVVVVLVGILLLCGNSHAAPAPDADRNTTAVITSPAPVATAAPVYPGMGGAPVEVLTNMYPTVKGNATITGYIRECGVGSWHEEQLNTDFKSARLSPANSCGKQLVFSIRKSAGRDDPTQIGKVWIIGVNETWSDSMNTVYPGQSAGTQPAPVATATPIYPGMGAPVDALKGRHPSIRNNAAIQEYIRECGVGRWDEKKMDTGFLAVHIPPGNSCGKQLVFLTKTAGGYDDPTKITGVWILDVNETWSGAMDPVQPSAWEYRVQELLAGIRLDPVFVVPSAVIALVLLAVLFSMMRRTG